MRGGTFAVREWGARQKARWRESRGLRRKWSAVGGGIREEMFLLSAITSGGIYLLILVLSLLWLIRGAKERVDAEITP